MSTQQEIKEGIQRILLQYMGAIHAELIHSHDDVFLTEKIIEFLDSKGVVVKVTQEYPLKPPQVYERLNA